jgi:hypothetical protein
MGPEVLPLFRAVTIREGCLVGRFDASPWAEENAIAGLYLGGGRFLWGRFSGVDRTAATCEFRPDDPSELLALQPGGSYPYADGYYGERAELVLDPSRTWHQSVFHPTDSVRFRTTAGVMETRADGANVEGGERVPCGWDHEHCSICWSKIGVGGWTVGYVDQSGEWVCEDCHGRFVEPRSIDFVTWVGGIATPSTEPNLAPDQRIG